MKVLVFTTQFFQKGGAENLSVALAKGLVKEGIEAQFLTLYDRESSGVRAVEEEFKLFGITKIHSLGLKIHPNAYRVLLSVLTLRSLLKKGNYDFIETSSELTATLASWSTLGLNTKHLAGIHTVYDNHLTHKETVVELVWKVTARLVKSTIFYAISDFAAKHWAQYSSTSIDRTVVIYNEVDEIFYREFEDKRQLRESLDLPQDAKIVIFCGRLAEYKDFQLVWEALSVIVSELNILILFVGSVDANVKGSQEIVDNLKNKIQNNKLSEHVRFLGWRDDVSDLLAASDVLAHPTQIEAFGLSLVEALAVGLPVASTNVEAIPEILVDTKSILFDPGDAQGLREAILTILNRTQEQRQEAARLGRDKAEKFRQLNRNLSIIELMETNLMKG